jgi:hypothetical protein
MRPFLAEVAGELQRTYGAQLNDLCLVFPNQRAGIFFNKYLGECLEQPVWSPSIYTIQDLMSRISDVDYADDLELISLLYRIYAELRGSPDGFDEFLYWGGILLSDFDELDKYRIDARDLFRNLSDLKDLEKSFDYLTEDQVKFIRGFWSSFNDHELSDQKKQFIEIWNLLHPLYIRFRARLSDMGLGYEGMVYRSVAENLEQGKAVDLPFIKFIFIGFNALNPCEQLLFKSLGSNGRALFYWDYDEYYLQNETHEAGRFIRENLAMLRDSGRSFRTDHIAHTEKKIRAYSIPSDAGQAQIVHELLEKTMKEAQPGEETAIVLADEELLIPVLNALPTGLKEINVTMGYPVTATPVFSLIEHLINLQRHLREGKKPGDHFYHSDVLPILQHQYILLRERKDSAEIVDQIQRENILYIPRNILKRNELFNAIFRKIEKPEDISGYLLEILRMITSPASEKEERIALPAMELEFIYRIYTRIQRLKDVLGRLEMTFSLPTFLRLFHKFLKRTRIPFTGEPLAGIQVMGVLETRVLDFDRIILLSMNEGFFPRTGNIQSFIPYGLRMGFGLPALEHQDAIYAYYFYRLIQRANEVSLIYNNVSEGLRTGEKSRFIYQLKFDPAFNLTEWSGAFDVQPHSVDMIEIPKTSVIMQRLEDYYASKDTLNYISPSAMNAYIDCPLQFYFNYIAEIKEPLELKEEVDPAMFGTLVHETVRSLYEGLNNPVSESVLREIHENPDRIYRSIDASFSDVYLRGAENSLAGRNKIIREIIFTYVTKILEKDLEYCPFYLESLEKEYILEILVPQGEKEVNVRIGGKIDRIDRMGETYRIIDYKTGSGKMFLGSVEELFDREIKTRNRAAFQTFLYAKLFSSSDGDHKSVTPGVYLIRELFKSRFSYHFSIGTSRNNIPVMDYRSIDKEFTLRLENLISEIFDPSIPFMQTGQEETCTNCLYRGICHR